MKFLSDLDAQMFCVDAQCLDLVESANKDWEPPKEAMDEFVKRRRDRVNKLRDLRKSQNALQQWRHDRERMLKGIRDFHGSTSGKRFHRELGRFLATRIAHDKRPGRDQEQKAPRIEPHLRTEAMSIYEVGAVLKALSSVKTHSYIRMEYYRPLDEELDYWEFLEAMLPTVASVEAKVLNEQVQDITPQEVDLLVRLTEESELMASFVEDTGKDKSHIQSLWGKAQEHVRGKGGRDQEDDFYHKVIERMVVLLTAPPAPKRRARLKKV